jgi:hypothetical protein
MSACLLSLAVVSLLLPVSHHSIFHALWISSKRWLTVVQTAFHASFNNTNTADKVVVKVSRGTSVVRGLFPTSNLCLF